MRRLLVTAVLALLPLLVACGSGGDDPVTTVPPTTTPPTTSTVDATTTTTPEASTTSNDPTTTTTTATAPNASVTAAEAFGARMGEDAEPAIAALTATLGAGSDSGWIIGCPLDGDGPNERVLSWGSFSARFERFDGTDTFSNWEFRIDATSGAADPGGPSADQIDLPGGLHPGNGIDDLGVALGSPPVFDEVFGVRRVDGPTFSAISFAPDPGGLIEHVGVPFIATCE